MERSPQPMFTMKDGNALTTKNISIYETINGKDTGTVVTIEYLDDNVAKIFLNYPEEKSFSYQFPFTGSFNEEGEFVVVPMGEDVN